MAHPYAQPEVIPAAEFLADVPQTIVAAVAAALLQPDGPRRQVYLVVDDQHLLAGDLKISRHGLKGAAALVHKNGGLEQPAVHAGGVEPRQFAEKPLFRRELELALRRQAVHKPEAGVMTGGGIIRAWIAQARDES